MNILLIGGTASLTNKLIVKFKKEKHKVYLITGQRYKYLYYEKVYERFDFPYDGESLGEIFKSVKPDVTLFLGALDSNFKWENIQEETVHYSASLLNILMSYSMVGQGRFIYLSTAKLYKGDYEELITEETTAKDVDYYQSAMLRAEELCMSYRENRNLDIVTLRMDRLWDVPQTRAEVRNICAQMCLEALEKNVITYHKDRYFSWIHVTDAVEYIYRAIMAPKCEHALYQVTSGQELSEQLVAEKIKTVMESQSLNVEIKEENDNSGRTVLSNCLYSSELGINFFCDNDLVIKQITEHMVKNKEVFLQEEPPKTLWQRIVEKGGWLAKVAIPYIENLICFIPFFMLNNRAVDSRYFAKIDFYLLFVLLFAVIYGQRQATFSALLATCGYIFRQMYNRTGMEVILDYNTYVWIAQIFIVGLVVGYQKDQYRILSSERKEEKEYLSGKIADIADINTSNVRVKDSLQTQIVNQSDSIGKIYSITSSLEQYMPEEVLFRAAEVLEQVMNTKEVAIYTVGKSEYARLYTATSENAGQLGYTVKLSEMPDLYDELKDGKVFINRALKAEYPMMAVAIKNADQLKAILMIWGLSWDAMTLGTANMLAITASLIQNAVLRAERYLEALEEERYSSRYGVLEEEAFAGLLEIYENARKKQLTNYTLLQVENDGELSENIGAELSKYLRQSDYVGFMNGENVCILLANTKKENAFVVVERLRTYGYTTCLVEVLS